MNKIRQILLLLCAIPFVGLAQTNGYYFFDKKDTENIKGAAQTNWGQSILLDMEKQVNQRLEHSLRVPLLEGGHLHHYFCPVHSTMFDFDWNSPDRHYCKLCGKYWENEKTYDWAWINMVHAENQKFMEACMYLYLATGKKTYAEYIRNMMLDYAGKYSTYMEHNTVRKQTASYSGKMYAQSLDEAVWASSIAKAYSVAREIMTADEVKQIEAGYLRPCADMLLNRKAAGNWQVWHNSGLIALGVALQNDSIIQVALNDPKYGYYTLMNTDIYNDGWWNEGSPTYHYYPLRAIILSAEALRCRGISLYDKKLYNMLAAPALGVYSDLYFPAHNDGWYGESLVANVNLYETAYLRYQDPLFLSILTKCYAKAPRNSSQALLNNINVTPNVSLSDNQSICFKDLGVAVLRSQDKTVVLKYGPHGGLHGHPDKLSISIHNGKKELVTDLGTSAYGVPDYAKWYRRTLAHSTVTVDFKDQNPTTGTLVAFTPSKNGGSVEAKATNVYPGVEMTRKLSLSGEKLTDNFTCTSSDEHTYDYVLILTEKPQLPGTGIKFDLGSTAAYERISHAEKRTFRNTVVCRIENTLLNIQVPGNGDFEIITGEAPGVPPKNPALIDEKTPLKPSYPLIIRTKGKSMKINTIWNIN